MSAPCQSSWLTLVSQSPRRLALLREASFDPVVLDVPVDDSALILGDVAPADAAMTLAYFKAAAAIHFTHADNVVLLSADTFVVQGDEIIGKPADAHDADRMIQSLIGADHDVVTGVAIIDARCCDNQTTNVPPARLLFADTASVRVGAIAAAQRQTYIDSGLWQGKAGAYNLADRLDAGWPIVYTGDPGTIMGLPMRRLEPILSHLAPSPFNPCERAAAS